MEKQVIITGGGSGQRMQTEIPKQFLEVNGVPILFFTIAAFELFSPKIPIILTLPKNSIPHWLKLIEIHNFNIKHKVVEGGDTRFKSVQNALEQISNDCLVSIHDAVRPFVSHEVISNTFIKANNFGSAIPIVSVVDSIRKINKNTNRILNRDEIFGVQTPQVFQSKDIKAAYNHKFNKKFTDDASVYECFFKPVTTVYGNKENIKITTPLDLLFAETIVKSLSNNPSFPQIAFFKR